MSVYLQAAIFIIVSACLVWLSRRSIRAVRSHGFSRLFAWESILILILLCLDVWFDDWLSYRQIVSWLLLAFSVYLVTHGTLALHRSGRPDSRRTDTTLLGIEKTTELVTTGVYRYIRHPIYSSAVVGVWGVVLKHITVASFSLALISIVFLTLTAKMEETENIRYFGHKYLEYMKRTRMFIPFLF